MQTGYEFRLVVSKEIEDERRDVSVKGAPLARTLADVAAAFKCDFYSVDSRGFFVIPARKGGEAETPVGPYRLRAPAVAATDDRDAELTLVFAAADDEAMEAVAGLGKDLRVLDNFGRPLAQPGAHTLQSTSATRTRLTEYWHRQRLALVDDRATRVRSIRGSLVLYRKVTPLRFEFPLDGPGASARTQSVRGLEFRLERFGGLGRDYTASTRLAWTEPAEPGERTVVGRGISRTPTAYLVDADGRVYRDPSLMQTRSRSSSGETVREQLIRFDGVRGKPVRLVYEVLLKEQADVTLPFQLSGVPLPGAVQGRPERGPFYAAEGGTLSFRIADREDRPVEGEVSLGLSRKTAAGWSGWRWQESINDPDGQARFENLQPGTYRVLRIFRLQPLAAPLFGPGKPVQVTVTAKKETVLPPVKLATRGSE